MHGGKLQAKKWTEMRQLVENYIGSKYYNNKYKSVYSSIINQQEQIITCLKKKQYSKIIGKNMRSLYNQMINQKQGNQLKKYYQEQDTGDFFRVQKYYFSEGQKMIKQNQYQSALKLFEKVIKINKNNYKAYRNLFKIIGELNKQEQLILKYNEQINKNPDDSIMYVKRAKIELSIRDYDNAIESDAKYSVAYSLRANLKRHLKKYQQAKMDYQKAMYLNIQYSEYCDKDDSQKVLSDYDRTIELQQSYSKTYYNSGLFFQNNQQWELALKDYTKAIQINPRYYAAYNSRGIIYKQLNEIQKSLIDYNKAIELNPLYFKAYYNRAAIHQQKSQIDLALENYDKAIQINPQFIDAYYNRAKLYSQKQWHYAALDDYIKIIQLNPEDWKAYQNRAFLYEQMDELQMAINDMVKAMQLNQSSEYLLQIGIQNNNVCILLHTLQSKYTVIKKCVISIINLSQNLSSIRLNWFRQEQNLFFHKQQDCSYSIYQFLNHQQLVSDSHSQQPKILISQLDYKDSQNRSQNYLFLINQYWEL